ncbi:hypothetical protein M409DRAFT_16078 [Zasmidium cellare ATCC 36951]|uniref:Uncharacterized protein n=1 Tax=Zasmidium cellare ATCC 36951 TaxID=1080233 RepID=A0A6A6D323_ZASCE|nr:uncharacterized protein M409DRAFT_16078 [Zasmidium cellare ATCC 36951]KAF2173807.1 hypothetical protein M409DRAFT_16078 [Zasmidium cellare ATCC 36951]
MKLPAAANLLPATISLLLLTATTTPANAALQADLTSLKESIASATNTLIEFRNETTHAVNTAGMIQSVGWQVGAVLAGVGCGGSNKSPSLNGRNLTTTSEIEKPYTDYITSLTPLSKALTTRGQHHTPQTESPLPVIQQIQSLTRALYTLGK